MRPSGFDIWSAFGLVVLGPSMALAGKLVASHSSVQCSSAVHSPRGPALGSYRLLCGRGGRLLAGSNVGRANKPGSCPLNCSLKIRCQCRKPSSGCTERFKRPHRLNITLWCGMSSAVAKLR